MLVARADLREKLDARYSFARHLLLIHICALGTLGAALACLRAPRLEELWIAPAGFLFANFFEYVAHRFPMHHVMRPLGIAFARHTQVHHAYFRADSMKLESPREAQFVIFPWWAFLAMVALTSPAYLGVGLALGRNAGLLFLAVAVLYYLLYEWLHASYHFASIDRLARIPLLGKAARRHRLHHDPAHMTGSNFNITFPIFDYVFGTARQG